METMSFQDFVEINPRVQLVRGQQYPFVPMTSLTPGRRYVRASETRISGGGAKFCGGDTLFARITPCLENGKIAQFMAPPDQSAFGSTEFWIFRAKKGVSDPAFVFYLSTTDLIRKPAEKSMSGASGRQRADVAAIREVQIPAFCLKAQRRISSILSAYDNLIENNTRRIEILEEMARRVYEEWFLHLRFPGHEDLNFKDSELGRIPAGWSVGSLQDVIVLQRGFDLPVKKRTPGDFPIVSASGISGTHFEEKVRGPGVVTGRSGSIGKVMYLHDSYWPLNTTLWGKTFPLGSTLFAFYTLASIDLQGFNVGAAVPTLNRNDIHGLPVIVPDKQVIDSFDRAVRPIQRLMVTLERKADNLRAQRDMLLHKLISGEINVHEIFLPTDKEVEAA